MDTPERETGVRQLVSRVAETVLRDWGMAGGSGTRRSSG